MKKLFGTDGIRGRANSYPITPELAMRVGKATAKVLGAGSSGARRKVVLGKDTRISGYMLENAITGGLLSMGMDVLAVGPMPTPAVAHLTRAGRGHHRAEHPFQSLVVQHQFNLDLGQAVHLHGGAPVDFGMPVLAAEAPDFRIVHAVNAQL
mgnify:CR=1 FL=1